MPIIKTGAFVEDRWTRVADDAPIPAGGNAIISLARWQAERDALADVRPLGIRLAPGDDPADIADDVHRFGVIAIDFPAFTDGRGFSYARLLRERYGYKGEIRATGAFLVDQYAFLARCGVDALEVAENATIDGWRKAVSLISVAYQPATNDQGYRLGGVLAAAQPAVAA